MAQRSYRVIVRGRFDGLDEEGGALTTAELAAMAHLDDAGLGYRDLRSSATCLDDVKVRRR